MSSTTARRPRRPAVADLSPLPGNPKATSPTLAAVHARIVSCDACPRLRAYCADIARVKKPAHRDDTYWGRPVPGFGDPSARVLVLGLAPAAHGANRTGRVFTGDTLLGSSTTTVWDLASYRKSLDRLLELPNLKVICPGHGKIVNDPRERLQMYVNHRNMRENQILKVLEGGGAVSSWDIMLQLYPDIDKRLRRAADNNVRSHLKQLEDEGRVITHPGKPKRGKPAGQRQKDVEHVRQRDLIIKQAKKFETEMRRAEIRAQMAD